MKKFLYLVQSRAEDAQKLLKLESARSDVLILTFDKQLAGARFIYGPNTIWPTGRNMLIERARRLPHKYDYYIILDDDVYFHRGSFREFEDELLSIKPDFCAPLYRGFSKARLSYQLLPLKYGIPVITDVCLTCINRKLFYDPRLFPYRTDFTKMNINPTQHNTTFYSSWWQMFIIAKHFWDHKLIIIQNIQIIGSRSNVDYNLNIRTFIRFWRLMPSQEQLTATKQNMPIFYISLIRMQLSLLPQRMQLLLKTRQHPEANWAIYKPQNIITIAKFLLGPQNKKSHRRLLVKLLSIYIFFKPFRHLYLGYHYVRILWKHIKLNLKISLKHNWRTSDL